MKAWIQGINAWPLWRSSWLVFGARLYAPTLDRAMYLALHKCGISGTDERGLLESLVEPGHCVLDIGANVGLYTAVLSRAVGPSGRVHAFEPMPVLADAVRRLIEINRLANVSLHAVALGAGPGTVRMSARAFNSGDNRIRPDGALAVPVARGDDELAGCAVDFIKIDVQGYELPALRGLGGVLGAARPMKILFEYWPRGMELAGFRARDLIEFLDAAGFGAHRIAANRQLLPIRWSDLDRHLVGRPWGACQNFVAAKTG